MGWNPLADPPLPSWPTPAPGKLPDVVTSWPCVVILYYYIRPAYDLFCCMYNIITRRRSDYSTTARHCFSTTARSYYSTTTHPGPAARRRWSLLTIRPAPSYGFPRSSNPLEIAQGQVTRHKKTPDESGAYLRRAAVYFALSSSMDSIANSIVLMSRRTWSM